MIRLDKHNHIQLIKQDPQMKEQDLQDIDSDSASEGGGAGNRREDEAEFAMKMMHKPTLRRERAIRYDTKGEMQMINNLDKVYCEIEVWTLLNHSYIVKLYEMIDDDDHDYLYLILEIADMGQIAHWDVSKELYVRN